MTVFKSLLGSATAMAMVAVSAVPAMAAPVSVGSHTAQGIAAHLWQPGDDNAERSRRYRGHRGYRHRRGGVDAGDVLAGVLVIGGIAAIASAASKNSNDRRYQRDSRYEYRADDLDAAADQCGFAAEDRAGAGAQLERVTSVSRDGPSWRVEGTVASDYGIDSFSCGVTDGRVDYIQLGN